jgi:hypothetical protein
LALLEWLGIKEVDFGLTGMDWNGRSRFWTDCNGLEWRKSFFAPLKLFAEEFSHFSNREFWTASEILKPHLYRYLKRDTQIPV